VVGHKIDKNGLYGEDLGEDRSGEAT